MPPAFASLKFCVVPGRDDAEVGLSLKQQGLKVDFGRWRRSGGCAGCLRRLRAHSLLGPAYLFFFWPALPAKSWNKAGKVEVSRKI